MKLSADLRSYLTSEFRTAAEMASKHNDPQEKAYYLSAPYGAVQRALNVECSSELILLWLVLSATHAGVQTRVDDMKAGTQAPLHIPSEAFTTLTRSLLDLADRIDANDEYTEVLERLSAVAYSLNGNGFYLYSTGRLKYE